MTIPMLTIERLETAVRDDAAIRFKARLQPAGGPGDKVFPPTHAGGQYAMEKRVVHGAELKPELKEVVLLDSVQSQANRMEQALLAAYRDGLIQLPMVEVSFENEQDLKDLGSITVLDAPHRLADAILRDSLLGDKLFPVTAEGEVLRRASTKNATDLFRLCPTCLLFGVWDSAGEFGGLGVKFQRALVSEIVGIGVTVGRKTASRIDPLQIEKVPIYARRERKEGEPRWTVDPEGALLDDKGKPVRYMPRKNAKGVPSEINHGNVTPDIAVHKGSEVRHGKDIVVRDGDVLPGGVTFEHALQTAVFSLAALRKLHFPLDGKDASHEARVVLAALGLVALTELRRNDYDLRSRCALVLDGPAALEIVRRDGTSEPFTMDDGAAKTGKTILRQALAMAEGKGLSWRKDPIVLKPSRSLADLVRESRKRGVLDADESEDGNAAVD